MDSSWARRRSKHEAGQCLLSVIADQVPIVSRDHGNPCPRELSDRQYGKVASHQVSDHAVTQRVGRDPSRELGGRHGILDRAFPCVLVPRAAAFAGEQWRRRRLILQLFRQEVADPVQDRDLTGSSVLVGADRQGGGAFVEVRRGELGERSRVE